MSKKETADWPLIIRVFGLAKPYRSIFYLSAFLAIALAPISIIRPYLVQLAVDQCIIENAGEGLIMMILYLVFVLFLQAVIYYIFTYSTGWLGQSIIRDLRIRVFKHINSLRLTYFDRTPIGNSITRTINDVETINNVFSEGFITIVADFLTLIFVLGIMFITSWKLTLVCLLTVPFLVIATYLFKEAVKKAYEAVRTQVSRMNEFLQERISGMRIVQIFNAEEKELENFKKINGRYAKANINSIFYYAIFFPVVELLSATSLGLMVWYGAKGVLNDSITIGTLIAFPLYIGMLFRPIRILADKFNTLQMGLIVAKRIFRVLDNDHHIENVGQLKIEKIKGAIQFSKVSFSYDQDKDADGIKDWILNDLSFDIEAGTSVAIVGSTGAGKSTIINLLHRFYEFQLGQILIDGIDIREYELFSLRSKISVVLQNVFLFSGSVLDNITLRSDQITRAEVEQAAKKIGAHEFIMRLPGNYDYQVMERGATLSMGQRQLISFVRAIVFQPDVLILDEATSSVDPETEGIIQYAIEKMMMNRTSIIIAHRLSTIKNCDKIMYLSEGKLIEQGNHQELMLLENGHYRELVETAYSNISQLNDQ